MTEMMIRMLEDLETNISGTVGKSMSKRIMMGLEAIGPSSTKEQLYEFSSMVIDRLDELVSTSQREEILSNCSHDCVREYSDVIKEARKRRLQYGTIREFLEAEERETIRGIALTSEKGFIRQIYQPRSFDKPMRCYCKLFRYLPDEKRVSPTYCHCSQGFIKEYWQKVLGVPVKVDIIQSAIAGGDECIFEIRFNEE